MCRPLTCYSWPLWWPLYLLGLATATAARLSAASRPLPCNRPSQSLIKLHVLTLRLNPSAGKPQPYVMRGCKLKLVPPNCGVS